MEMYKYKESKLYYDEEFDKIVSLVKLGSDRGIDSCTGCMYDYKVEGRFMCISGKSKRNIICISNQRSIFIPSSFILARYTRRKLYEGNKGSI